LFFGILDAASITILTLFIGFNQILMIARLSIVVRGSEVGLLWGYLHNKPTSYSYLTWIKNLLIKKTSGTVFPEVFFLLGQQSDVIDE
jgi:hypothetical protein